MNYKNPIIPGFYPDPSIVCVDQNYYLVTSSFHYFPGVPIFQSKDLINWHQIGYCLTRQNQLPLEINLENDNVFTQTPGFTPGIFAPTIRYHAGYFYMVTTNVNIGKHFVVFTDNPHGEWSEPIWIEDNGDIGNSIDPSLFFEEDGLVYLTCNGTKPKGIYQYEIDIKTGKRLSDTVCVSEGFCGKDPEGPHLYKINEYYYLLTAEGGTEYGHLMAIGRSLSPWGPFEGAPNNPILSHRSYDSPIQATGHGDIIQAHDGSWWVVFLGVRPNGYPPAYHLGRETFLSPLEWTQDGWPIIGENGKVGFYHKGPEFADSQQNNLYRFYDDFSKNELGLMWNHLWNPHESDYSLVDPLNKLRLNCSKIPLNSQSQSPTFVGLRQQLFQCKVESKFELISEQEGDEAGLVVYANSSHHYEIAIRMKDGNPHILLRRQIGRLKSIEFMQQINNASSIVRIVADNDWYRFYYYENDADPIMIGKGETRYLSTEVAGGFTGVYIGFYAMSEQKSGGYGLFDYFDYVSTTK